MKIPKLLKLSSRQVMDRPMFDALVAQATHNKPRPGPFVLGPRCHFGSGVLADFPTSDLIELTCDACGRTVLRVAVAFDPAAPVAIGDEHLPLDAMYQAGHLNLRGRATGEIFKIPVREDA